MFYLPGGIKFLCAWDNRVTLRYIRIEPVAQEKSYGV